MQGGTPYQGFRTSPRFREFFAAVRPFFSAIEEMQHYEPRPIGGTPEQ